MASVSRTLSRIKDDLADHLSEELILTACRNAGHCWRKRKFGPVETVQLFVLQVLAFNTAITHLRHLSGKAVNAAAYCKARMRLPLAALQKLLTQSASALRMSLAADGAAEAFRWCGLRAWLVDGSSAITPDVPQLQKAFTQPKGQAKGCGFPVPKVLGLFDAFTGLIVEMLCFPLYTHEQSKVWMLHPMLGALDLLVGDCGFCSYAHLAMLHLRGAMGLFRMHQRQNVDFRPHRKSKDKRPKHRQKGAPTSIFVKRVGKHDQIVCWKRPPWRKKSNWMSRAQYDSLPAELLVREIRYQIPSRGQRTLCVTIATTLLDPTLYSKEKIAELYGVRWRVETHFAQLKTTLKMRKLKSKTEAGVRKELAVYCLVYNLVHAVMVKAALQQGVTPERISFIDAVRWLLSAAPGEPVPNLVVNPLRPDRHEPRVRKDRRGGFPVMKKPRQVLRAALRRRKKRIK